MIYYTGDIHGQKYEIERFCKRFNPTREDTIVIISISAIFVIVLAFTKMYSQTPENVFASECFEDISAVFTFGLCNSQFINCRFIP